MRNDHSHELTSMECRRLLAQRHLGRVAAVVDDDGPAVYPVNYTLDRDAVLFHTDEPPRFGRDGQIVLQVDDLDEGRHGGWSVVVRGRASEVDEPGDLEEVRRLAPRQAGPGTPGHYIRLRQTSISGRRIDSGSAGDLPSNWLG